MVGGPEPDLVHREVELSAEPASVRRARHAVADALRTAGSPEDDVDTASLLVTELVTNAVVHARSSVGVTVTVDSRGVLVEVSDHSPHLPVQRSFASEGTTGRGLELVEALATDSGARRTSSGGKVVWFTLGGRTGGSLREEPGGGAPDAAGVAPETTAVRLLHVRAALFRTLLEHASSLLREHLITCLDERSGSRELADEAAAGNDALTLLTGGTSDQLRTDRQVLDLEIEVPGDAAPRFRALGAALDRAVRQAARGELLAPPSQPEIRRMRRWVLQEVLDQLTGAAPTAWTPLEAADEATERARPEWDGARVVASRAAQVASDDAGRILAVSPAAEQLLGWPAEELVGRRLVVIIPPRLHEAHIAGFVRFLLTGERHLVGHSVRVPARRRDGSEVEVLLELEPERLEGGRTVVVGTLTPFTTA
ncbi:PAS domain S-box-containing protein [Motilibacter rhizosphaerae]|uniref:PAS domain S-box-containing protein n=1 Tax=Motilibacter rhizosphaerae TaxID=598652 RepID=A0A4V2F2S4_9ACTN|nr:ATP-binding protein [Motilibacter rhizosphaerae]RZS79466.1 PAS domain S-box-containing protein [Motilibacter rhizosphaerae]